MNPAQARMFFLAIDGARAAEVLQDFADAIGKPATVARLNEQPAAALAG